MKRKLKELFPDIPLNTIGGCTWDLAETRPAEVFKPERGLFVHAKFKGTGHDGTEENNTPKPTFAEQDFYAVFAEWLVNELEECTHAIPLGGNKFKDKWGTPDVIGVLEPKRGDIIKAATEVVSAEIKIDSSALITAFGQASSYKLFSHRAYLVVPSASAKADLDRLDALCRIVGIGLILFDACNPEKPNFQIRVRAARHEPDMFYVNKNLKEIEHELFGYGTHAASAH